jgi:hypothetical protein
MRLAARSRGHFHPPLWRPAMSDSQLFFLANPLITGHSRHWARTNVLGAVDNRTGNATPRKIRYPARRHLSCVPPRYCPIGGSPRKISFEPGKFAGMSSNSHKTRGQQKWLARFARVRMSLSRVPTPPLQGSKRQKRASTTREIIKELKSPGHCKRARNFANLSIERQANADCSEQLATPPKGRTRLQTVKRYVNLTEQ